MKKTIAILLMALFYSGALLALDAKDNEPNRIFHKANSLYEGGEYTKALEGYLNVMDAGIESGNLYYNIGNGFFKLGKLGYAILSYEKAKRLIPGDRDLKSNLSYAKSLAGYSSYQIPPENMAINAVKMPFRKFNLNTVTLIVLLLYLFMVFLLCLSIANRYLGEKMRPLTIVSACAFLFAFSAFITRYYDESILKHGIVLQKDVECKYEPIDKSTTYYKLAEGDEVLILKTRNDWRYIKRLDGKVGWIQKGAVDPI